MNRTLEPIQRILSRWAETDPLVLARSWVNEAGEPCVELATHKQAQRFLKAFEGDPAEINISVMAAPELKPPHGFFEITNAVEPIFRSESLAVLTTDIDRKDGPMRGLFKREGALLVQLWEGTMGWIDVNRLREASEDTHWTAFNRLANGEAHPANISKPIDCLIAEARSYLDVPYVLGGRSRERIDCSGLTSRVFRDALQWVLPRHSTDQRRCGVRETQATMRPGDLIFARLGKTNVAHVGFVSEKAEGITVIHASQRASKVVEESINEFFTGYRFMGIRRLVVAEAGEGA